MPRTSLTLAGIALAALLGGGDAASQAGRVSRSPHLDSSLVPPGCSACHAGHGVPDSPMLSAPVSATCLPCHESEARLAPLVQDGQVAPQARPPFLEAALASPFRHPLSDGALSATERDAVTCTSCHSPHRGSPEVGTGGSSGRRKLSPRGRGEWEFELCESCHGNLGQETQDRTDLSRLLDPTNRSFHPVHSPAVDPTPSTRPELSGREINCTDCHGSDATSAKGTHGSRYKGLLRLPLEMADGVEESESAHALCYSCHDRERLFSEKGPFPLHLLHLSRVRASCVTCHDPHGSVNNRALVRFGDTPDGKGVTASTSTGRLAFESTAAGSGACWLACHGRDHPGSAYGSGSRRHRPGGPVPPAQRMSPTGTAEPRPR